MDLVASPFSQVLSLAMAAGAVAFGFLILKILWGGVKAVVAKFQEGGDWRWLNRDLNLCL